MNSITLIFALCVAAVAIACGGGGGGESTKPTAGPATATPEPDISNEYCIDHTTLPLTTQPWEVPTGPFFFRFGLPQDVLDAGQACRGDITLLVVRAPGAGPDTPAPAVSGRNLDNEDTFTAQSQAVTVPGEESAGAFFNASLELPSSGRWEFSVTIGGQTGTYTAQIGPPGGLTE